MLFRQEKNYAKSMEKKVNFDVKDAPRFGKPIKVDEDRIKTPS